MCPPLLETDERLRYITGGFLQKNGGFLTAPGIIASSDQWNEASEQIRRIREKTGALCEEMEAAAVWMTAKRFRVPCAFVRIISNNNERGLSFDPSVCETFISLIEEFPHVINGYLIDSLFPSNRERLFLLCGRPL